MELAEWRAYDQLEPFGDWRADYRAALLASLLYNAHRGKNAKPLTIDDFMPVFDEVTRKRKKDSHVRSLIRSAIKRKVE